MIFERLALGLLVDLEPDQARLLHRVCSSALIPISELHEPMAPPKQASILPKLPS